MADLETLTAFFGWCTVLLVGILILSSLLVATLGRKMASKRARVFRVDETFMLQTFVHCLTQLKMLVFVLGVVPYCALKLMG
ncbi:MAG: DUF6868 family protein [Planctomycetota bacterium]|jgi:hypothetical protein